MCGRYTLTADLPTLESRFHFRAGDGLVHKPRYNIAPTQDVLTVVRDGENRARSMRWGLIPFWAKGKSIGSRMINARAEGLAERSAFRNLLPKRRCLVLADSFYEWRKDAALKTPMRVVLKSREPFAFAGLWDTWKAPSGELVGSCTIVTAEANELVRMIYDRMPVILSEEAEAMWLDPGLKDPGVLTAFLRPIPGGSMDAYAVGPAVNSARNDSPECIEPAG